MKKPDPIAELKEALAEPLPEIDLDDPANKRFWDVPWEEPGRQDEASSKLGTDDSTAER